MAKLMHILIFCGFLCPLFADSNEFGKVLKSFNDIFKKHTTEELSTNKKLSDDEDFLDANVRRSDGLIKNSIYEGEFVDIIYDDFDTKKVEITFLFSSSIAMRVYYTEYDTLNKVLEIDFFDADFGESLIESIYAYPILSSKVTHRLYNFNAGIIGFEPDIRDIIRISLHVDILFPYEIILDDFDNVMLVFVWNKKIEKKLKKKSANNYFNIVSTLLVLSGTVFFILYEFYMPQ